MGWDGKYGKVVTEYGDIPDDEPVIVFRGRDKVLPKLLEVYGDLCRFHGSPESHLEIVAANADRITTWQHEHPDRTVVPSSQGPAGQRYDQTLAEKLADHG